VTTSAAPRVSSAAADETYPTGLLDRSPFGYEWREDPPDGRSGAGPWLVPKMIEIASAVVQRGWSVPVYRPPRGKGLLRRFIELADADLDQIREFANGYGSIGMPTGESLTFWRDEILAVRDLAKTLDDARRAVPPENDYQARRALSSYFRHVDGLADPLVLYTYGPRRANPVFTRKGDKGHGFPELGSITDATALVRATKALAGIARTCVQVAIESRLEGGAHVSIRYEHDKDARQPPQCVPATLLGAIYLGLDRKLRGQSLPPRACANSECGKTFVPKKRIPEGKAACCGPTCRKALWRLDPEHAVQEARDRRERRYSRARSALPGGRGRRA